MADISQIKLPNNNTYNFKDTVARGVKMYYGICTTAAATAAKVVTVGADQDFKLTVGALVMIKFTISNTASNVTINVNNTGAKSIYYNNSVYTSTSTIVCGYANAHLVYMYDGTNWVWVGHGTDNNTTYNAMSVAEGQTATATSARSMRADYLKQIIQYHAVPSGQGVPSGGTTGQVLAKVDGTDYNTEWIDAPSGGGSVEKYTVATFDKEAIPATDPFCWFIEGAKTTTATADYSSYFPLLKTQVSRSGWNYLSCYLFRKEESGSIYALFVGVNYYTLFVRKLGSDNVWSCVTPMPGPAFLFSMSGATPTLKLVTISYSATMDRPQIQCDPETLLADNTSNRILRAKFIATVVFDDSSVDAVRSIQVPMIVGPNGSCFEFLYNNSGTLYRVVCKRTAANTWTATATAL